MCINAHPYNVVWLRCVKLVVVLFVTFPLFGGYSVFAVLVSVIDLIVSILLLARVI